MRFPDKCLFSITIILLSVKANAIEITDYKPPVSQHHDLDVKGHYDWGNQYYENVTTSDDGETYEFIRKNDDHVGYFEMNYHKFYLSDPFSYSLYLDPKFSFSIKDSNTYDYEIDVHASTEKYLYRDFFAGVRHESNFQPGSYSLNLAPGIGYGRFYDGTALVRALRIQEELYEDGMIHSDLEDEIIIAIASEIDNSSSYNMKREHYQAIIAILEKSTQFDCSIGKSIIRLIELIERAEYESPYGTYKNGVRPFEMIQPRPFGYIFGIEADFGYARHEYRDPSNPVKYEDITTIVYCEYGYPFSLRLHFSVSFSYEKFLTERNSSDADYQYGQNQGNISLRLSYEVSDKIDNVLLYQMHYNDRFQREGDRELDEVTITHTITNRFYYYLEANFYLELLLGLYYENKDESLYTSEGNSTLIGKDFHVIFGYDLF